jgi:cell division protein ZapA (FtsZ GTPase activity inhibitor)
MTQIVDVEVVIHGKPYTLSCQRGQEGHLRKLAEVADERVNKIWRQVGKKMVLSETKLLVMTLLMLADELFDAKSGASPKDAGTLNPAPAPSIRDTVDDDAQYEQKIQAITDKITLICNKLAVSSN